MTPLELTALMFLSMIALMLVGMPIAFCLGTVGSLVTLFLWGEHALNIVYFSLMSVAGNVLLTAVPLFIFMGFMLHHSGIAADMFDSIYKISGGLPGALAVGTIGISAVLAAMIGLSGPTVLSLGVLVVPAMLQRRYHKTLAVGTVLAGGALGFLIPPSLMMVMYGFVGDVSVGRLFAAGVMPGLMLAGIYVIYVLLHAVVFPDTMPVQTEKLLLREKLFSLRYLIGPFLLIASILGTLFTGMASPTEAAALGAGFSIVCAAAHRKLNLEVLLRTCRETLKVSGFAGYITICAIIFSKTYTALGATSMIRELVVGLSVSPWMVLIIMQLSFFVLGMFLDDIAILFLCMPIYLPIVRALGFDPVWFGILYVLNMQMAYLTPPYGLNLFYMKAVAPKEISIKDIYVSVVPFLVLQLIALALVMLFPKIALWLPDLIFNR